MHVLLAEIDAALDHFLSNFLPVIVDFRIVAHAFGVGDLLAHFVHSVLFLLPSACRILLLLDELLDLLISFLGHHLFNGVCSLERFFVFYFDGELFVFAVHFCEVGRTL